MAKMEMGIKYYMCNTGLKSIIPLGDHCPRAVNSPAGIISDFSPLFHNVLLIHI